MTTQRLGLVPAGDPPERSVARGLRQLGWSVTEVVFDEEANEPSLLVRPGMLDASVEVAMVPGAPTFVIAAGAQCAQAWRALADVIPHYALDDVLGHCERSTSVEEKVVWLDILAGVSIGRSDDPAVISAVTEALTDRAPQVRAAALLVAASSLDAFESVVRTAAASDPDPTVARAAADLLDALEGR